MDSSVSVFKGVKVAYQASGEVYREMDEGVVVTVEPFRCLSISSMGTIHRIDMSLLEIGIQEEVVRCKLMTRCDGMEENFAFKFGSTTCAEKGLAAISSVWHECTKQLDEHFTIEDILEIMTQPGFNNLVDTVNQILNIRK